MLGIEILLLPRKIGLQRCQFDVDFFRSLIDLSEVA